MTEQDEQGASGRTSGADNSIGRLLTLSDGVFAIAMTLLALDLKVPSLGPHPSDAALRHALAHNADSYWSFLLTFYVVGRYWNRHRRLLRSVDEATPALIRDTLVLLLVVAAMPFPSSLLGNYGGQPISLSVYGAANAAATLILLRISVDVRRLRLTDDSNAPAPAHRAAVPSDRVDQPDDYHRRWQSWLSLLAFLLCLPAGYLLGHDGPYVLVLLAIPDRAERLGALVRRVRSSRSRSRGRGRGRPSSPKVRR